MTNSFKIGAAAVPAGPMAPLAGAGAAAPVAAPAVSEDARLMAFLDADFAE